MRPDGLMRECPGASPREASAQPSDVSSVAFVGETEMELPNASCFDSAARNAQHSWFNLPPPGTKGVTMHAASFLRHWTELFPERSLVRERPEFATQSAMID